MPEMQNLERGTAVVNQLYLLSLGTLFLPRTYLPLTSSRGALPCLYWRAPGSLPYQTPNPPASSYRPWSRHPVALSLVN